MLAPEPEEGEGQLERAVGKGGAGLDQSCWLQSLGMGGGGA